jgi:DtxR family Mn-dependent transcriptional regulator
LKTHESAENYLEKILILQNRNGNVRAVDIANEMNFTKPSVSIAMKKCRENGYIEVDDNGNITFTVRGSAIARRIYERHQLLIEFLTSLGVSEKTAAEDACKIEHDISEESFNKIREYMVNKKNEKET